MKRLPAIFLSSALLSFAMVQPTELAAGNRSDGAGSVSAGDVGVSVGRDGASISAGDVGVSAGRGGASVSAGDVSVSAGRDGASVSAGDVGVSSGHGGASVSAGDVSVSAGRDGASVAAGDAGVSAGRGGGSVAAGRGDLGATANVNADRSDSTSRGDPATRSAHSRGRTQRSGDRSYDSLGEWFADLRRSWFGESGQGPDVLDDDTATTSRRQINRVVQNRSATATATDGGLAVTKSGNVNVTEQTD